MPPFYPKGWYGTRLTVGGECDRQEPMKPFALLLIAACLAVVPAKADIIEYVYEFSFDLGGGETGHVSFKDPYLLRYRYMGYFFDPQNTTTMLKGSMRGLAFRRPHAANFLFYDLVTSEGYPFVTSVSMHILALRSSSGALPDWFTGDAPLLSTYTTDIVWRLTDPTTSPDQTGTVSITPTPEPASIILLGTVAAGTFLLWRRRQKDPHQG